MFKPYRNPTQVNKRKYAKVNGWNLVKELGKQVAVSSQYGLPLHHTAYDATEILRIKISVEIPNNKHQITNKF